MASIRTRTIVIGDVHGCRVELERLLEECELDVSDRVIFVGDLIAKGPDSRGVVQIARELGARAVRGNHDERCLTAYRAQQTGQPLPALKPPHQRAYEQLSSDDLAWLDACPLWIELPWLGVIVVHAGLLPGVSLENQDPHHLMNMRSIRDDGTVTTRVDDGEPWASQWPGPEEVVFGHDAVRGLQRYPHATGLDTGCVYGGRLTAYVLPERRLVSVDAERAWWPFS